MAICRALRWPDRARIRVRDERDRSSRRSIAPNERQKMPICRVFSTGATGLEPATSGVTGRRSNQLNYAPLAQPNLSRAENDPRASRHNGTRDSACPDEHRDEETYLAARAEQFAARMESEGVSRKRLLQRVGSALPLLAGGDRLAAASLPPSTRRARRSGSRCRPSGSSPSGRTPRHGGTRSPTWATRSRTSGSSSATTRRRRS